MSKFLRALWENTYGLLVDDGQLAIGAIAALAISWVLAQSLDGLRIEGGWILLGLVLILLVANTYRSGLNARRKVR